MTVFMVSVAVAEGPRDVDPYLGVYEGVYEHDGKTVKAEAMVTTLGSNVVPYRGFVLVDPERIGGNRFVISSMFHDLEVYTSQDGTQKGVNYAYYDGDSSKMDFDEHTPAKTGIVPYFSLEPAASPSWFGFKFTGFVKIPATARYRFLLASDDGSRLLIDGKPVVENPGCRDVSSVAELEAGLHAITVTYFQMEAASSLWVGVLKESGESEEKEQRTVLMGEGLKTVWRGSLLPDQLVLTGKDPKDGRFVLEYKDRQSPTLGLKPPADAIVLLGMASYGVPPSLDEWTNKTWTLLPDGSMQVGKKDTRTIREFGDQRIHLEFMCPFEPEKIGQGRGNSGVYVQGSYELQVLDSFGFEPARTTCGAVYYVEPALRSACLPPLTWQTYDVIFRAPRFNAEGTLVKHPVFERVEQNGRVIHENLEVKTCTHAGMPKGHTKLGPLWMQEHGNPVRYRNIWIVPLEAGGGRSDQ
jgi:hypothetical protein